MLPKIANALPFTVALVLALCHRPVQAQHFPIADGWARTKVNTSIFRHNAVCSFKDQQVAAFYDPSGRVILASRRIGERDWQIRSTGFRGRPADAHNGISIAFDGRGILHLSWDHHASPLRYARAKAPGSLEISNPEPMLGRQENRVTYPEFYNLPNGDLLFFYRDGASGAGNLVLNRLDARSGTWTRVHDNLIDGEGKRNAYWQVATHTDGAIHLSWVWRETPDVVTNHDIAYAKSTDGGRTWMNTSGKTLDLPIREQTAELAARVPQNSELANQTSMAVDHRGNPVIANFWRDRPGDVPQYRLVRFDGRGWINTQVGERHLDFLRKGAGTKRPPVSRPLLLLDPGADKTRAIVLFRDAERGRKISAAICDDLDKPQWTVTDITPESVGQSDPLVDIDLWHTRRQLHLFTQFAGQGDGETQESVAPQKVSIYQWMPPAK